MFSIIMSIFSMCGIWSLKAGVAVRLHRCISPPASCLAQVNGDTKASGHIQALLEFATVGDLDPEVSSGSYRPANWSRNTANVRSWSLLFWLLFILGFETKALIVVWKLPMWTACQPVLACQFCHYCSSDRLVLHHKCLALVHKFN